MSNRDGLKRVVVLRSDDSFGGEPDTIYGHSQGKRKKKSRKKQSKLLSPTEKMVFGMAKRLDKATADYRERQSSSNKKKKNGWIRDYPKNLSKALSKAGGMKLF